MSLLFTDDRDSYRSVMIVSRNIHQTVSRIRCTGKMQPQKYPISTKLFTITRSKLAVILIIYKKKIKILICQLYRSVLVRAQFNS